MNAVRTYFDYNASAPLRPAAKAAMLAALDCEGNASSVHLEGRKVRGLIEDAREKVAALVGAKPGEVVFTSGATESNNWVVKGAWDTILVAGIEHDSVLAPAQHSGARIINLGVDRNGVAMVEQIGEYARKFGTPAGRTLVSLQWANNETGIVQPVAAAASMCLELGFSFHTDAVQAAGRLDLSFAERGIDALSLSSHKIGGPKGAGALIVRDGAKLLPLLHGGGQERRRRAGTENIAAIAGFGAAAQAARDDLGGIERVRERRDLVESEVLRLMPEAVVIGQGTERLANTACIAWPGILAQTMLIKLDLAGIAVSAGAACSSGKVGGSRVLEAMGLPKDVASSAIRISLGPETTMDGIKVLTGALGAIHRASMCGNKIGHGMSEQRAAIGVRAGE